MQYLESWRTVCKLALPNMYLTATADDAPETASERKFGGNTISTIDPITGKRRGLLTALENGRRHGPVAALTQRLRRR